MDGGACVPASARSIRCMHSTTCQKTRKNSWRTTLRFSSSRPWRRNSGFAITRRASDLGEMHRLAPGQQSIHLALDRPGLNLPLTSPFLPRYVRPMNVVKATRQFEQWLGHRTDLIKKDLRLKLTNMRAAVFPYLRATYYRWAQLWPKACSDLAKGPRVLAVGDLHVENFGTWRDTEGRLIWGVNDFDEACVLPYTNDLVRLAVSAHLAIRMAHPTIGPGDACDAILAGYLDGWRARGCPFV